MKGNQLNLFATDENDDQGFEAQRAKKAVKKLLRKGEIDFTVILPTEYTTIRFAVNRNKDGVWWCQFCHPRANCHHIRKLQRLVRLKVEAGYTGMSDKDWLKEVLIVGDVQ